MMAPVVHAITGAGLFVDGRWQRIHHHGSIEKPELFAGNLVAVLGG